MVVPVDPGRLGTPIYIFAEETPGIRSSELLDTLDLIPGMSHNTNLGITSTMDARPKDSTIASKQARELCSKKIFIEDF
jgi:hypothetical protein